MKIDIVELAEDASLVVRGVLTDVRKYSVLVARPDERYVLPSQAPVQVDFEGGIYERPADRQPTEAERIDYAKRAAGRSVQNYPTVARRYLPSMKGLRVIGSVDTETWEVEFFDSKLPWADPSKLPWEDPFGLFRDLKVAGMITELNWLADNLDVLRASVGESDFQRLMLSVEAAYGRVRAEQDKREAGRANAKT